MNYLQTNCFNIVNPQDYICIVHSRLPSHSLLLLKVYHHKFNQSDVFYLTFGPVEYYEGPLGWNGANFCIAADDEYAELMDKLGLNADNSPMTTPHLYVVELPRLEVRILAGGATKTSEIPKNFHWLIKSSAS